MVNSMWLTHRTCSAISQPGKKRATKPKSARMLGITSAKPAPLNDTWAAESAIRAYLISSLLYILLIKTDFAGKLIGFVFSDSKPEEDNCNSE